MTTTPSSDVGDVLAPIGGVLEEVEDLLPLDDHDRIALLLEERPDGALVDAIGLVLEPVDLDGAFGDAGSPLERLDRHHDLLGRDAHEPGELARVRPHRSIRYSRTIAADASIASITSSSDRASVWMSSRSSGVTNVRCRRWMISWVRKSHLCSTSLISSALSQIGLLWCQHLLEHRRAAADLFGELDEVVEKPLFTRYQSEGHESPARMPDVVGPENLSRFQSYLTESSYMCHLR